MVSASPVSVCPWQTSAEVLCHLFMPPSNTPEITVAVASLVSPVAAGKTEVAFVGVPGEPGATVVVGVVPPALVVVGTVPPAVVVLVVVTAGEPAV